MVVERSRNHQNVAEKYQLENLANFTELPPRGAKVIIGV